MAGLVKDGDNRGTFHVRVGLREGKLEWDAPASEFVEFRVYRFNTADTEEPLAAFSAAAHDLGLDDFSAPSVEAAARPKSTFAFPTHIHPALHAIAAPGSLVWWQIEDASGYLPGLPWERALWNAGSYRVVRPDSTSLLTSEPRGTIDVALCFSCAEADAAAARRVVEWFFRMLPTAQQKIRVHIFADYTIRELLRARTADFVQRGMTITVYEPDEAGTASFSGVLDSNPWLAWMQSGLRDVCVDVMHFICEGALGTETGNIHFGRAIVSGDDHWASPIGPRGIDSFLSATGVWSAGFSSPLGNPSPAGMRYFCHLLARQRPGPVMFHDMEYDPDGSALIEGYRFFRTSRCAGSPAVSLFWNPLKWLGRGAPTVVDSVFGATARTATPLMLRAQRELESSASRLERETNAARREGREQALRIVAEAFATEFETEASLEM